MASNKLQPITAKSFDTEDSAVFSTGNFSAKYIKRNAVNNNINSNSNSNSHTEGITPPPIAGLQTSDINASNPITIAGGFSEASPGISASRIGASFNNQSRRESLLSSSISRSLATHIHKPNNYVPDSSIGALSLSMRKPQSITENDMASIVERHIPGDDAIASDNDIVNKTDKKASSNVTNGNIEPAGTNYNSMKLPGGFLSRDIEHWVNEHKEPQTPALRRAASSGSIPGSNISGLSNSNNNSSIENRNDNFGFKDMIVPGGFRRSFLASRPSQNRNSKGKKNAFITNNFIEFLTIYGHFAGEDLREDDDSDYDETEEEEDESDYDEAEEEALGDDSDENNLAVKHKNSRINTFTRGRNSVLSFGSASSPVLGPNHLKTQKLKKAGAKKKIFNKDKHHGKKTSTTKAFLLLLKAFLGTGIVFLPKAFSNGGLLFCNVMIVIFSVVSYYCFVILIKTTHKVGVSGYGDAGFQIYGKLFQTIVLLSLTLSQLGFSSSYVVFVGTNFKELVNAIWNTEYTIEFFILIQCAIFVPLSLTRNISKLGFTALVADAFILFGLLYIYFESSVYLVDNGVSNKISMFQPNTWTLFIGTAVFAYEGIGLLIPIQESMAEPEKFNKLLLSVMIIVTFVFTTLASISYLSFGDDVHTVILMNFSKNATTLTVQLCYTLAILLSTPIQLFPAIKILENYLFHKNRKTWKDRIRRNSEARSLISGENNFTYDSIEQSNNLTLQPVISESSQFSSYNDNLINNEGLLSGKSDTAIKCMKNILRVSIVIAMCTIGYVGSNKLDKFVSLVGSFTCVPLIYIYPSMLYLKCFGQKMSILSKLANLLILIVGCILMAYTSFKTINDW